MVSWVELCNYHKHTRHIHVSARLFIWESLICVSNLEVSYYIYTLLELIRVLDFFPFFFLYKGQLTGPSV